MSQLIFQNEEGSLKIGGGSAEAWRMTELSGLGLSAKSLQTAVLFAEAGQKVFGEHRDARVITPCGRCIPEGDVFGNKAFSCGSDFGSTGLADCALKAKKQKNMGALLGF